MSVLSDWLETRVPRLRASLGEPLTDEELAESEALVGRPLPADYVAFLREHDGQRFVPGEREGVGTLASVFSAFEILAASYCRGEWRSMREWGAGTGNIVADGPVRPLYQHEAWWPFTVIHGSSWNHCIDLDPAPGGDVGQVILVSMKDSRRTVIASSFQDFMERLVAILEESPVEVDEERGIELDDEALGWLLGG